MTFVPPQLVIQMVLNSIQSENFRCQDNLTVVGRTLFLLSGYINHAQIYSEPFPTDVRNVNVDTFWLFVKNWIQKIRNQELQTSRNLTVVGRSLFLLVGYINHAQIYCEPLPMNIRNMNVNIFWLLVQNWIQKIKNQNLTFFCWLVTLRMLRVSCRDRMFDISYVQTPNALPKSKRGES